MENQSNLTDLELFWTILLLGKLKPTWQVEAKAQTRMFMLTVNAVVSGAGVL